MQCLVEVVCEGREVKGREAGGGRGKGGRTGEKKRKSLREEVGMQLLLLPLTTRFTVNWQGMALILWTLLF